MAEAAGLVIGAVGLVALADTVSDCFAKIETARNLGSGFVEIQTQIAVAKLRYTRWLESVRLMNGETDNIQSHLPVASATEAEVVKNLLGSIEIAFNKGSKSASKYLVQEAPPNAANTDPVNVDDRAELAVRITQRAERHQRDANLFHKVKWSLRDAKGLQTLATKVSANVANLTTLFPATKPAQTLVATEDVRQIAPAGDTRLLELLAAVAMKTDPIMKDAANAEAKHQGHKYDNMTLHEKARALYGNDLAAGATAVESSHDFRNSTADGETRAIYGDRVGFSKSFLDD